MWRTWGVAILLVAVWLAVALASAGYKVHRQRMWLDSHLESGEMVTRPGRRCRDACSDRRQPRNSTWGGIAAGVIVFGLVLAAFALLLDVLVHAR